MEISNSSQQLIYRSSGPAVHLVVHLPVRLRPVPSRKLLVQCPAAKSGRREKRPEQQQRTQLLSRRRKVHLVARRDPIYQKLINWQHCFSLLYK